MFSTAVLTRHLHALVARGGLALATGALRRLPPGDRAWLARHLLQDRFHGNARMLAGFFQNALAGWHNNQHQVLLNGEAQLLRRLAPFGPRVVFDVGANDGDWSVACAEALPDADIHAFEIDPTTAAALRDHLATKAPRARVNALGLSDKAGEVSIFLQPGITTQTSLVGPKTAEPGGEVAGLESKVVHVKTGDAYVTEHQIASIDLLKLDVEGAEPKVLDGFRGCFEQRRITLVQFEYGGVNASIRYLLEDFYHFFRRHGFVVGKLYPEGVAFKEYEVTDEDFRGPNFVACRQDRPDIVAALRCAPLQPL